MRKLLVVLALLSAAPLARAQQSGERLYLIPPSGWQIVYHDRKGGYDLTELVPPGQTVKDWTDMLTVEMIQGRPASDVQTTLNGRLEAIHKSCAEVGAGPPQLSVENGYDVGVRAFACPRTSQGDRGEVSLYKVLLGGERTYLVSRAWSGEPFDKAKMPLPAQTTSEWLAFMSKVVLCDPSAQHPCPQPR